MDYKDYIELGLNGEHKLKVILCGYIENDTAVVSVVYATLDKEKAKNKLNELIEKDDRYYMVYSVPLDTDLEQLTHYPSIAISKNEFNN